MKLHRRCFDFLFIFQIFTERVFADPYRHFDFFVLHRSVL